MGDHFKRYIKMIKYNAATDSNMIESLFGKDAEKRKKAIENFEPIYG